MFLSCLEEIGKVERKPVAFLRVQRTSIAIDRKLHPGFNSDGAVHPEQAGAEEHLLRPTAQHLEVLALKRAGSFAGELPENSPIPSRVIGAPGKRPVTVNGAVSEQIGAAVTLRFRVTLVGCPYPDVLASRSNTRDYADEVSRPAVQIAIETRFRLGSWNENTGNGGRFDTLTGKILSDGTATM